MRSLCCSETSYTHHPVAQRHIPHEWRTFRNSVLRLCVCNSSDALVLRVAYTAVHSNAAYTDNCNSVAKSGSSGANVPLCWTPGVLRNISVDNLFDPMAIRLVMLFHKKIRVITVSTFTQSPTPHAMYRVIKKMDSIWYVYIS